MYVYIHIYTHLYICCAVCAQSSVMSRLFGPHGLQPYKSSSVHEDSLAQEYQSELSCPHSGIFTARDGVGHHCQGPFLRSQATKRQCWVGSLSPSPENFGRGQLEPPGMGRFFAGWATGNVCTHIYVCIYVKCMYVCVCVCMYQGILVSIASSLL